jgi:threonine/homoserine/homoserine lactone efflux protein
MGDLLTKTIPLALGAAISPTVLAVGLLILSAPKRPVARGAAFTAGVLVILAGLTVVGLTLTHHAISGPAKHDPISRAIDGTFGAVLLLLAIATVLRALTTDRESPDPKPAADPAKHAGLAAAFLLGMAMMMANFSTILLYLPAMREISAARLGTADKAVVVVIVFLITSLAATLPLLLRVVAPGPASRWFTALHGVVTRHQRQIAVVVEVIFGAYLLAKAI